MSTRPCSTVATATEAAEEVAATVAAVAATVVAVAAAAAATVAVAMLVVVVVVVVLGRGGRRRRGAPLPSPLQAAAPLAHSTGCLWRREPRGEAGVAAVVAVAAA